MRTIKKQLKRAFTIVELVIVIAVVAALAAILIPTFVNVVNSANESKDTQMLANINKALAAEDVLSDIKTPEQALDVAEATGYNLQNLTPSSDGNYIVYDQESVSFALVSEEGEIIYSKNDVEIDLDASTTWYFATSNDEITSTTASYILTGNWTNSSASVGKSTVKSVKSAVEASTSDGVAKYKGVGAIDTSKANGIKTVEYTFDVNSSAKTNIVLNVYYGKVVIDLSGCTADTITINNYGSKDVTVTVTATADISTKVELKNHNEAEFYVEETISSVDYEGSDSSETYTEVKQGSYSTTSGTLELGTKSYPYLISSSSDLYKINNGGYCQVTADFTSTTALTVNSTTEATLDLNGYKFTISGTAVAFTNSGTDYYAGLINNGALTILDSTATDGELVLSGASYGIYNTGSIVLESGKINAAYSAANGIINYADDATIIINGGEVYAERRAIYNNIGTLEINDGTISSSTSYKNSFAIYNSMSLVINGGDISGYYGVYNNGTSSTATVNINGCDVSGEYQGLVIKSGIVSIGTLNADNSEIKIYGKYSALDVDYFTTLDIYSGTITGEYGINYFGRYSSNYTTVSIYGGIITGTAGFGLCGNGSSGYGYVNVYVYGGTITSETGPAIYNPQQAGVTYIYGGTITGVTGVEIRNSEVHIGEAEGKTIDALVITATGNPSSTEENHNGSTTNGMAIAISTYNEQNITVTIGEGIYSSGVYALYEENVNGGTLNVTISVSVTGGTFKGIVYSENSALSISGGMFTNNTNLSSYCASGYAVSSIITDGYYTVSKQ